MTEHKIPIPGRIYNASGGNVCGANDVIDDVKGKKQSQINTEVDNAIQNEIERATEAENDRYTKSEVYKKEETYNKTELNNLITTPSQEYVTVVATDQTTAATDVLPATGSADTIYRVGNWDGSQYDESLYTEYAWNGSAYVSLNVKSQVGEIYDISLNHAGATYADLDAALGVDGANIPVSLRKGGMSVKFVQTSDNKYVQFRCKANAFTTDTKYWCVSIDNTEHDDLEWVFVVVTKKKQILGGFKKDGSFEFSKGVPTPIKKYIIELLNNKVDKINGKSLIIEEFAEAISANEDFEFVDVKTDKANKILEYTRKDGTKGFTGNVEIEKQLDVKGITTNSILLNNTEISPVSNINNLFYSNDTKDWLETTLDKKNRVISYRREDGLAVENVGIAPKHIEISNTVSHEIAEALNNIGYTANNPADWSESEFVEIPIPEVCAVVNIEVNSQAEAKGVDIPTYIQFWDKNGNYFRKPIELNAQGSSSMGYHVKNQAIDFTDGSKIKFGNWPAFDSFHIKKYFIDVFRGQCIVAYWLTEQVYLTRPYGEKRPWDYLNKFADWSKSNGSFAKDFESGAMAHPDGFPVHLFFNGKDAGIYAFNIKKDRSNYNCKKTNQKQIILDGVLGSTFWTANGDLRQPGEDGAEHIWDNFEVRNPKIDKDINGNKYDGDNPKEPSDTFATTKAAIERLTTALSLTSAEQTTEAKRAKFEEFFNIPFLIDYELISQLIFNYDGYRKNWIWCCWDGNLWCPTSYDMDSIFGQHWNGASYVPGSTSTILGTEDTIPTGNSFLKGLYTNELRSRYKELRDNGVLAVNNIVGLLEKWVEKCGYDNLKHDIEDIVTSPYTVNGNIAVDGEGNPILLPNTPSYRDDEITYVYPPHTGGWYNSIQRVKNWLTQRIANLDVYYNY